MTNTDTAAQLIADAPAKVQRFLTVAHDRGLTVGLTEGTYWVSSPNPIDDFQLWFHYTAGANGGRLNVTRYTPTTTKRSNVTKITQKDAMYWVREMADGLDRHHAREAAKAQAADTQPAPRVPTVAFAPAPVEEPLSAHAEAELILSTLKPNAKFAIRTAGHGHIPRNTPLKVRAALVRRGLVDVAGGILTDLGRAARNHLVGA